MVYHLQMGEETIVIGRFEWDKRKAKANLKKHGVDFFEACQVFLDENRVIAVDDDHSLREPRFFCIGRSDRRILTVRFTYRRGQIRIIGAGAWRKGKKFYENEAKKNKI